METSALTSLEQQKKRHVIRWYILVLPGSHKGPATGLQNELERRNKTGGTLFEYFAPTFVEAKEVNGKLINTQRPLFYNYVFVHASESEIFKMKQYLPQYNFLPRVQAGKDSYHYPFLTDQAMQTIQWIARSYSNIVPVYTDDASWLAKGDRIRITQGQFKNIDAQIVVRPHSKQKEVMACIDNWMWVPLLKVNSQQYEIIALNSATNHLYTHINNERRQQQLDEALQRYYGAGITPEDRQLAEETILQYAKLHLDSEVMRCKQYALLLPAYTILDEKAEKEHLINRLQVMCRTLKAEQSLALLVVTLYGCTDNSQYYDWAHKMVDPWRAEPAPKKSKKLLIQRLGAFDGWLGH